MWEGAGSLLIIEFLELDTHETFINSIVNDSTLINKDEKLY